MGSDGPMSKAKGALAFMEKLSPNVLLYCPNPDATALKTRPASPIARPPRCILLAPWMAAADEHIAKYVAHYQSLFPTACLILVRGSYWQVTLGNSLHARAIARGLIPAFRKCGLLPSATATGDETKKGRPEEPELLIHALSNGGVSSVFHAVNALGGPSRVPPHVTILDSAPGKFRVRSAIQALVTSCCKLPWLARLVLVRPIAFLVVLAYWLRWFGLRRLPLLGQLRFFRQSHEMRAKAAILNQERAMREARRCYIYSETDQVIDWRDVEEHARDASKRGFETRLEEFSGTKHVEHMRGDPERYWRVVRETWEGTRCSGE